MSKYLNKSFIVNLFITLGIFGLDRFTKVFVISENEKNLSSELLVSKFLRIKYPPIMNAIKLKNNKLVLEKSKHDILLINNNSLK